MVDVSGKAITSRRAIVRGRLLLRTEHREALGNLPKGDALTVAQIAGVLGAKRTAELVPLCHSLPLSWVDVRLTVTEAGINIETEAVTDAQTGVEMEAYCGTVITGVTLIDMLKGVHPDLTLTDVQLVEKTGGKSAWKRE